MTCCNLKLSCDTTFNGGKIFVARCLQEFIFKEKGLFKISENKNPSKIMRYTVLTPNMNPTTNSETVVSNRQNIYQVVILTLVMHNPGVVVQVISVNTNVSDITSTCLCIY